VNTKRVSTEEELRALARAPRAQVRSALEQHADPVERYCSLERDFGNNLQTFENWVSETLAAMAPSSSHASGRAVAALFDLNGVTDADLTWDAASRRARFEAAVAAGDIECAYDAFLALEARFRRLHDAYRDTLAYLWSAIHRDEGREALDALFVSLAEPSLLMWMDRDVTLPAAKRIRDWSRVLMSNFASIEIIEHDEYFVIEQDPCGTCGRQVEAGRYDADLGLARVEGVRICRTHVDVMHDRLPRARIGVSWPAIECPTSDAGVCRVYLMKDPMTSHDPRARARKENT
jgi:hypothetical protein